VRIVHVTESLEYGGAERVIVTLANEQQARHAVYVVCAKREGELRAQVAREVAVTCLGKGEGNSLGAILRLARLLKKLAPDVVHTHDWGVFLDVVWAAQLANVQHVIHSVHGRYMAYPETLRARLKKRLRHWLERRAIARCSAVVCVSRALCEDVAKELGIESSFLRTVYNGVAVGSPSPRPVRAASGFRFVAVGRLVAVKNLGMLIEAFATVAKNHTDATLRIVGDGPERDFLERRVAEMKLAGRIAFSGFVDDIDAVMRDADAVVLSSLSEGMPMSILEAMRAGLPVIATRVGGIPEIVIDGRTGILVASKDTRALANAMESLIGNRDAAARMGQAGYERLTDSFSIERMIAAYEELYQHPVEPACASFVSAEVSRGEVGPGAHYPARPAPTVKQR
jgi:glycosyltransferase involved in cell wall biosynthesis